MQKLTPNLSGILDARFGGDNVIAFATLDGRFPTVRNVDAYYENGAFYIITNADSDKMKQLARNASCAVSGEGFRAQGIGISLGFVGAEENRELFAKLRRTFTEWPDNGLPDRKTIILKVRLTNGVLFSEGKRYDIDFT